MAYESNDAAEEQYWCNLITLSEQIGGKRMGNEEELLGNATRELDENDYVIPDGINVWFTVGQYSIWIKHHNGEVTVEAFPLGDEDGDCLEEFWLESLTNEEG